MVAAHPFGNHTKAAGATSAVKDRATALIKENANRELANAQFLNYGATMGFGGPSDHARTVFAPGKRRRINLIAICVNVFLPFFVFAAVYCVMSFKFHYQSPGKCWLIVALLLFSNFFIAVMANRARKRDREPIWLVYTACSIFFAVLAASIFGNLNYVYNLLPYYEIDSLNTYPSVNPAHDYGQMLMDAGRIYFADGTGLDMKKASSFKNTDLYCVAPIVTGTEKLSHYDFWAVGMNCCSGVSPDFRCGQFNNPKARSGLRITSDSSRPYYRLAVQMAAAQFDLLAPHPLFFTWIQDPVAELAEYLDAGWRYFLLGVCSHFAFNLFCALSATVVFSKIGNM